MASTAKKRTPAQIDKDRAEIARLYLQGRIQSDIAAQLKMTQQMVSYDLIAIRQAWLKSSIRNFDEAKSQELAKVDNLEVTAWQAWERSLEQFKSKVVKARGAKIISKDGETIQQVPVESSQKSEDRNGDPRYLDVIKWCIERRCKIFGLDAPIAIDWRSKLPPGHDPDEVLRQFAGLMNLAAEQVNPGASDSDN